MNITSKKIMSPLYASGEFGNRLLIWPLEEFPCKTWHKNATLMYRGAVAGVRPPHYGQSLLPMQIMVVAKQWIDAGYDPKFMVVSENDDSIPRILQGEVQETEHHLDFRYTTVNLPMRPAFEIEQLNVRGIIAHQMIRQAMDEPSWENLWRLLDTYSGHVVEFSCYERGVGILGWNSVFWETRLY